MSLALWTVCLLEGGVLLFNVSVAYVVLSHIRRKKSPFTSLFYRLFACLSIIDCFNFLLSSLFQRLIRNKLAPKFFVDSPVLVSFSMFSCGYLSFFEYLTHTMIAFDRYVIIVHPASSVQAWMERRARVVLSLQFLLPLAFACTRPAMIPSVFEVEDGYAIRVADNWALRARLCSGTHLTRALYAFCGLVSQLLIAAYYIVVYTFGPTNPNVYATTQLLVAYIYDVLTLSGPVCLFITSEALRKAYFDMYALSARCNWAKVQPRTSAVRTIS